MVACKCKSGDYYAIVSGVCLRTRDGINYTSNRMIAYDDEFLQSLGIEKEFTDIKDFFNEILNLVIANSYLYEKAQVVAEYAHFGQLDKGGSPYFKAHLLPVATSLYAHEHNVPAATVALLHDILEDTDTSEEALRNDFTDEIVDAVVTLTHRRKESYDKYILRVKQNPLARLVKMYNLANNMDLSRIPNPTDEDKERILKYARAYSMLMS